MVELFEEFLVELPQVLQLEIITCMKRKKRL
jgi:hypothetical protein